MPTTPKRNQRKSKLEQFLGTSRKTKRVISVFYDLLAIPAAITIAYALRLGDFNISLTVNDIESIAITMIASILVFTKMGLYRAILRYIDYQASLTILIGLTLSSLTLAASNFYLNASLPRSVPIIYIFTGLFFIGLPRLLVRSIIRLINKSPKEHILIYGAGQCGHQLAATLQHSNDIRPIAFIDDNPRLLNTTVRGLNIYPKEKLSELIDDLAITRVLLALGSINRQQRNHIINSLEELPVKIQTIPSMGDITSGKAKIEELTDIQIEDLLGRDPVKPSSTLLNACIKNKSVMVTGAGGSIGSELCRQIIKLSPSKLILHELNEFALYSIEQELQTEFTKLNINPPEIIAIIGSVQNQNRLETVIKSFSVETIYHAAAYKHVPLVEHNIVEGVRNNVFGTLYCAEAAINCEVETFVLISTDKAVRPTNIMGASKRMAELVLQGLSSRQSGTRFCMVRFGNVLGSSGSVVPMFRNQIKKGGPLTVTHPDITRYFMTIPEAAQLVIQAGSMGEGGDVFVLNMGEPVKIADLATKIIHLSGLSIKTDDSPDGDIEIVYTGLRPGEKLYEELLIGNNVTGTENARIMRAEEKFLPWNEINNLLTELNGACHDFKCVQVKELLQHAPTDFSENHTLQDHVWNSKQHLDKAKFSQELDQQPTELPRSFSVPPQVKDLDEPKTLN